MCSIDSVSGFGRRRRELAKSSGALTITTGNPGEVHSGRRSAFMVAVP
jgi:hypothetical protein